MKNKKMFAACVLAAMTASPVMAQNTTTYEETVEYSTNKHKVETNSFWNNWFISVGGGVNFSMTDHDKQMKFGDRLAPALDIAVGKWFAPGIGVRLAYSGLSFNGATQNGAHSDGTPIDGKPTQGYWLENQDAKFATFRGDVLFNCSNLFFGYNPNRVWNCSPYVGLGWTRVWEDPQFKGFTASVGILNTFRLSNALDLNLDVRGNALGDDFDGENGSANHDGLLSATVGLTYKFKSRGWDRSKTVYRYDRAAERELQDKLRAMGEENERLRNELANQTVKTETKYLASPNLVVFRINQSKLDKRSRANLGMMAETIKKGDSQAVYIITGYADAGTGSKETNQKLSKARAEAVRDCLVNEFGVNPNQLRIDHKGGVDTMFYNDPRLSRAVITRAE